MRHLLATVMLAAAVLSTASCGFHTHGNTQIPPEMKTMVLNSSDPYGPLARTVRQQLRLNNITIVTDSGTARNNLPTLRLENEQTGRVTASIFMNGTTAEYQLSLTVNAQILLPGKGIFPLHTTVYRSFFGNNGVPLAKDSEQDMIYQEMRIRASSQLVRQLLSVHVAQRSPGQNLLAPEVTGTQEVISSHAARQLRPGMTPAD